MTGKASAESEPNLRELLTGLEEAVPLLEEAQQLLEKSASTADAASNGWSKVFAKGEQGRASTTATKESPAARRKRQRLLQGLKALCLQLKRATAWLQPLQTSDIRTELMDKLDATARDLQTALMRLATLEKERQEAVDMLQVHQSGHAPNAVTTGSSDGAGHSSSPTLQAALERALNEQQRAADMALLADRRLQDVKTHEKAAQEARAASAAAQASAEKARAAAAKHQAAVAALTGDNLVLLLRVRGAEDAAAALRGERDELKASLEEQKGPWFEEVRAGVRGKVAAAMERAEALEARMDAQAAAAAQERQAAAAQHAALQQQLHDAGAAADAAAAQLRSVQADADRAARQLAELEAATKEDRERAVETAAENRILIATLRSMQDEVHACKDNQHAAEGRVAQLEAEIASLQQDRAAIQVVADAAANEVQKHKDVNAQLMARKQEIEWQLMQIVADQHQVLDQ